MIRKVIRSILLCRADEPIVDCIERRCVNIKKRIDNRTVRNEALKSALDNIGICSGDNIMVHCSWRNLYQLRSTPEEIINILLTQIGSEGTLVMPCYTNNTYFFDVDNDRLSAGVLSEVFRNKFSPLRSRCSHFACAAKGKYAQLIIAENDKCIYGFDQKSAYYKFSTLDRAKIILLGLGKASVKLSLYHLVEPILKDEVNFFKELLSVQYTSTVVFRDNDRIIEQKHPNMIARIPTRPNKKNIKKIYRNSFCKFSKVGNIDLVSVDAKLCSDYIMQEALEGKYMIKLRKKRAKM
nr:AAC(3) family N-acetyltransferase [uncultured Acetatifactor sp.]